MKDEIRFWKRLAIGLAIVLVVITSVSWSYYGYNATLDDVCEGLDAIEDAINNLSSEVNDLSNEVNSIYWEL